LAKRPRLPEPLRSPRHLACEILDRVGTQGSRAGAELSCLGEALPDERDLRLATELVYGTLRRRLELDHHLENLSGRPLGGIDPRLLSPLRIGLYQILHLDRVPGSAAVNESVTIARERAGSRSGGFVNAVLRKACLKRQEMRLPEEGDPRERLALRCSLPGWMVSRWWDRLGEEQTCALAESLSQRAPTVLHVNPLRTDPERLAAELLEEGVPTRPSPLLQDCLHALGGRPRKTRAFREGRFYLQDEASRAVILLMEARPGDLLIDCCAAPGGKSLGLARAVGDKGCVIAVDRSLARLRLLEENRRRLGISVVFPVAADLEKPAPIACQVSGVFLDAPCTGTGILRRQPDIRWRRVPADITSLSLRQSALLETAASLVAPRGRLVYSVCSLEREEGEDRITDFLARHPAFARRDPRPSLPPALASAVTEEGYFRTWPHRQGCDGFFAAVLDRTP
jgi:16S rRNA (cytosine967-C5)-methyltransferase